MVILPYTRPLPIRVRGDETDCLRNVRPKQQPLFSRSVWPASSKEGSYKGVCFQTPVAPTRFPTCLAKFAFEYAFPYLLFPLALERPLTVKRPPKIYRALGDNPSTYILVCTGFFGTYYSIGKACKLKKSLHASIISTNTPIFTFPLKQPFPKPIITVETTFQRFLLRSVDGLASRFFWRTVNK